MNTLLPRVPSVPAPAQPQVRGDRPTYCRKSGLPLSECRDLCCRPIGGSK